MWLVHGWIRVLWRSEQSEHLNRSDLMGLSKFIFEVFMGVGCYDGVIVLLICLVCWRFEVWDTALFFASWGVSFVQDFGS